MFARFLTEKRKCYVIASVALLPCFWPTYRYSIGNSRQLIETEGVQLLPDRPTVTFQAMEKVATVYFNRFRWEEEAAERFGGQDLGIGENSFLDDNELRFRRHNLSVSIHLQTRNPLTEREKAELVRLAESIDRKISNLEGTTLSFDTLGNKAFLRLIKPMFEEGGRLRPAFLD